MENQKNFVQQVVKNNDILPIEVEILDFVSHNIEKATGKENKILEKLSTQVFYDVYRAICDKRELIVKINLSPELPNFWQEICEHRFSFHPKIVSFSHDDEYKFVCFESPSGIILSDVSSSPLSPKLNLIKSFVSDFKKIHQTKIKNCDNTVKVFNSLCPIEASMICRTFPVTNLLGTLKVIFKNSYTESPEDCGLCHFDISPENVILSGKEFKFLNFEYADTANIYIDLWLLKETMNMSDQSFLSFLELYDLNKSKLHKYRESADLFIFAYFNSKIIAEYMTFGLRDPIRLRYWINKSEIFYSKVKAKLFFEKELDKEIRDFYNLWK